MNIKGRRIDKALYRRNNEKHASRVQNLTTTAHDSQPIPPADQTRPLCFPGSRNQYPCRIHCDLHIGVHSYRHQHLRPLQPISKSRQSPRALHINEKRAFQNVLRLIARSTHLLPDRPGGRQKLPTEEKRRRRTARGATRDPLAMISNLLSPHLLSIQSPRAAILRASSVLTERRPPMRFLP